MINDKTCKIAMMATIDQERKSESWRKVELVVQMVANLTGTAILEGVP
jgi:hypothetical protein